ncbi:ATP-grasp domain-containing protein [Aneurinibacillus thermoaerophilus]|nr:ATP-grasp domain-containing protein [Aneurinibacillus thermoaerophilus]MED0738645.1 ATP-grasp domain-containing protein [Aneurinibacillus thermoaerophilus]QYY43999.1 ATP-grasp domain-containing protein [Aneurinibacillus thermoaerophilus]
MAILIFNRSKSFHFKEWLSDLNEELVLFTQVSRSDLDNYNHVEMIESFDQNGWTEIRAIELHKNFNFHTIIGHSEYDLIRAARLREKFCIRGQRVESALAFRNKVLMKQLAAKGGVEVPTFRSVNSSIDLFEFIEENGFPIVIKPIDGGGSRHTQVLYNFDEMKLILQQGLPTNLMVEKFVSGEMYHVDGIMRNGEILFSCASRYINGCLAFTKGASLGSVILDKKSRISNRLHQALSTVLASLPGAPILAFHAEFFHTDDDRLLLCEIASRTGGGRIIDTIREVFGIDLNRLWIRLQCGLDETPQLTQKADQLAGFLIVPPKNGKLLHLPKVVPFEWVVDYTSSVQPGQTLQNAASSVDSIATLIVKGTTEKMVESRLNQLNEWYMNELVWEEEWGG